MMFSTPTMFLSCFAIVFLAAFTEAAGVLNRTPLAATAFGDAQGQHIRVYYQSTTGQVKVTNYDEGNGWTTQTGDVIGHAKLNTGLATISWDSGTEVCSTKNSRRR
jgi:hypothetical protein